MSRFLCMICAIFNVLNSYSQRQLHGTYRQYFDYIAQTDVQYQLYPDGRFIYESWDDVGDYIGFGNYTMSKDSITFNYHDIPEKNQNLMIYAKDSQDTISYLAVFSSIDRSVIFRCSYEIIENDSTIERGEGDGFGQLRFVLKPNQILKGIIYQPNSSSLLNIPNVFKIHYEKMSLDYVILTPSVRHATHFIASKTETFQLKVYRKANYFGIKKNNNWQLFEKISNN